MVGTLQINTLIVFQNNVEEPAYYYLWDLLHENLLLNVVLFFDFYINLIGLDVSEISDMLFYFHSFVICVLSVCIYQWLFLITSNPVYLW